MPRRKCEWRHPAEAVVRPLAVINPQPGTGQRSQFGDRLEEMRIEDFGPIAAVEALDIRILIGLARLDVVNGDAVLDAPIDEGLRGEFGALSTRTADEQPCTATSSSRARVTRRLGTDSPITISKPSRFPSSIIVSKRTRRPS